MPAMKARRAKTSNPAVMGPRHEVNPPMCHDQPSSQTPFQEIKENEREGCWRDGIIVTVHEVREEPAAQGQPDVEDLPPKRNVPTTINTIGPIVAAGETWLR